MCIPTCNASALFYAFSFLCRPLVWKPKQLKVFEYLSAVWPGNYIRISGFIICNNICSQPHLRTLPTLSRYPNSAGLDDLKTLLTLSRYPDSEGTDDVKTLLTLSGYPDNAGTDDVKTLLTLSGYLNSAETYDVKTILTLSRYPEHAQDIASFRISQQR